MTRSLAFLALALVPFVASCGDDDITDLPTGPTPVAVTETFSETLNINGARTHEFAVQQAGTLTARITALAPDSTVLVGLAIGTWNGRNCQIIIPDDRATLNTSVTGTAQQTGMFCARVSDATGTLTAPTDYTIEVTHY